MSKILIVATSKERRLSFSNIFKSFNDQVIEASTADEAIKITSIESPELVFIVNELMLSGEIKPLLKYLSTTEVKKCKVMIV